MSIFQTTIRNLGLKYELSAQGRPNFSNNKTVNDFWDEIRDLLTRARGQSSDRTLIERELGILVANHGASIWGEGSRECLVNAGVYDEYPSALTYPSDAARIQDCIRRLIETRLNQTSSDSTKSNVGPKRPLEKPKLPQAKRQRSESTATPDRRLNGRNCSACAKAKKKCERQRPKCISCVQRNRDCVYPDDPTSNKTPPLAGKKQNSSDLSTVVAKVCNSCTKDSKNCDRKTPRCTRCMSLNRYCSYPGETPSRPLGNANRGLSSPNGNNIGSHPAGKLVISNTNPSPGNSNREQGRIRMLQFSSTRLICCVQGRDGKRKGGIFTMELRHLPTRSGVSNFFDGVAKFVKTERGTIRRVVILLNSSIGNHVDCHRLEFGLNDQKTFDEAMAALDGTPLLSAGRARRLAHTATVVVE